MTIKLNVTEVFQAAKKAIEEGRLAAFNDDVVDVSSDCLYSYAEVGFPNCVCAVGAGLSPEDLSKIPSDKMDTGIAYLAHNPSLVRVEGSLDQLTLLQKKHDAIMECGVGTQGIKDARLEFVEFLGEVLSQAPAS